MKCPNCGVGEPTSWTCHLCGIPCCSKECQEAHEAEPHHARCGVAAWAALDAEAKALHKRYAALHAEQERVANARIAATYWLRPGDVIRRDLFVRWHGHCCWRKRVTRPQYDLVHAIESWDQTSMMRGHATVRVWSLLPDGIVNRDLSGSLGHFGDFTMSCGDVRLIGHVAAWEQVEQIYVDAMEQRGR